MAPETLQVVAEIGVSPAGLYSKGLNEIDLREYRLVIKLSDHSLHGFLPTDGAIEVRNCPVPDPYGCSLAMYRRSREAIDQVIIRELCREEEPRP